MPQYQLGFDKAAVRNRVMVTLLLIAASCLPERFRYDQGLCYKLAIGIILVLFTALLSQSFFSMAMYVLGVDRCEVFGVVGRARKRYPVCGNRVKFLHFPACCLHVCIACINRGRIRIYFELCLDFSVWYHRIMSHLTVGENDADLKNRLSHLQYDKWF